MQEFITIETPDSDDYQQIQAALTLLCEAAPSFAMDVLREPMPIVRQPGACSPNAIACTSGAHGRKAMLSQPVGSQSTKELAITIWHEIGGHHGRDLYGNPVVVGHTDETVSRFVNDPIYRREIELDRLLSTHLGVPVNPARLSYARWKGVEEGLQVVALLVCAAVVGAGIGATVAAIMSPRRSARRSLAR